MISDYLFLIFIRVVPVVVAVYFLFIWKTSKFQKELEKLPSPPTIPFFGNSLHFIGPLEQTLPKIIALCIKYGSRVKCTFGFEVFIFLWGVEDLEKLLSSKQHIEKGGDYDFLMPWLGSGLLTSKDEKWGKRRKMLTPSFHFKILDQFIDVFNEQSLKMVQILKMEFSKGQVFDVTPYVKRCTLDIICETAMGKQINSQDNRDTPYLKAIHRIGELFQIRSLSPWLTSELIWRLTYGKEEVSVLQTAHRFTEQVIQERKEKFVNEKEQSNMDVSQSDADIGLKKKLAFLDLLLEAQKNPENFLTDADIRQETDTFMFGGHDTTASNIGFTLFLFGSYPDIQAKVQEELDQIFGEDRERPVTTKDFIEMKYMESCLKESLRLYPSAPMITRRLKSDFKLDDNVTLPAGVTVIPFIYQLHRDPKHFPNPEEFNPDRFYNETSNIGRHPYAYIPFSAGPRNCIGQKFALMEEKVIIANILRNFKLTSVEKREDLKLLNQITLGSKSGVKISLEPR